MTNSKIKVGIIGGTGYTGAELLRLLALHPHADVSVVASRSESGRAVADVYPNLRGHIDAEFEPLTDNSFLACDLVFSATPNGVAMQHAPRLLDAGIKFIDLAADFRLRDVAVWEHWYGMTHACPELLTEAVYGLPEVNRAEIAKANLIANPGCYPTATTLGFLPLVTSGALESGNLIADVKSGVSGAGRSASVSNLFSEVSDSFKAYGVSAHRHHPEIEQNLSLLVEQSINLTFVPHLVPMLRGIHATLYADTVSDVQLHELQAVFEQAYASEPFVDVMPLGSHPETRSVKSSNMCRIALHMPVGSDVMGSGETRSNKLIILSAIDNLVKGAAGQAIQNMNIMFGIDETSGLLAPGLLP